MQSFQILKTIKNYNNKTSIKCYFVIFSNYVTKKKNVYIF